VIDARRRNRGEDFQSERRQAEVADLAQFRFRDLESGRCEDTALGSRRGTPEAVDVRNVLIVVIFRVRICEIFLSRKHGCADNILHFIVIEGVHVELFEGDLFTVECTTGERVERLEDVNE